MKSIDKNKLKKQLVSGGIYIALAAAVVTVTLNGVNNIIGGSKDYEIPEEKLELPENKIELFEGNNLSYDIENGVSEGFENDLLYNEDMLGFNDKQVNDNEDGITDEIINPEENIPGNITDDLPSSNDENNVTADVPPLDSSYYTISGNPETVTETSGDSEIVKTSGEPDDIEYPTEPEPTSYGVYAKPAEGYIDKEYSADDLIYSVTMGDYRTHNGVDITGDIQSPVKAINAGTITDIYYDDFYGNTVKIDHGDGIVAYYMNLSESFPPDIEVGTKVKNGQTIGGIGNSAIIESTEVSHLHLSVTKDGSYIDPRELLRNNY